MPGPYGSLANPVEQDPFQQIVAVNWPGGYLALDIKLKMLHGATTESCSDPSGVVEDQPPPRFAAYLTETQYDYVSIAIGRMTKKSGFQSIEPAEVSLTKPDLGAASQVSHAAWAYRAEGSGAIGDIPADVFPGSGWVEPAGDPADIHVPGGAPFLVGPAAVFRTLTQAYEGALTCRADTFSGLNFKYDTYALPFVEVAAFVFDVASIVAVWKGRAYRGFARQIVQDVPVDPTETTTIAPVPGHLWVLLQRSKADDPPA